MRPSLSGREKTLVTALILFVIALGGYYLLSPRNLSGASYGDGFVHAQIAETIIKQGKLLPGMPYTMFDENRPYPIHYTQFYHLSLGLFNFIFDLETFSIVFNLFLIGGIALLSYLTLRRQVGLFAIAIAVAVVIFNSNRFFLANFIETYLVFIFLAVLFLASKYHEQRTTPILVMLAFFTGILAVTKHMGTLIGFTVWGSLVIYLLLTTRRLKSAFIFSTVFLCIALPPLYFQYQNVGSLGYGVGIFQVPSFIPFHQQISDTLFVSKFNRPAEIQQYLPQLSYLNKYSLSDHINQISNFPTHFGAEGANTTYLIIALMVLGFLYLTRIPILFVITTAALTVDAGIMVLLQQKITQYHSILIALIAIYLVLGIHLLTQKLQPIYRTTIVLSLFILLLTNFTGQHNNLFNLTGRRSYATELIYSELGQASSYLFPENEILMGSNPLIGYFTHHPYLWLQEFYYMPTEKGISYLKTKGIHYLIVSQFNISSLGLYDSIPPEKYNELRESDAFQMIWSRRIGDTFTEVFRVNY